MFETPAPTHTPDLPFGLVVNPASALGRGRRVARRVERALADVGVPTRVIAAASAAECQQQVRASAPTLRGLILVGGDGVISTVLQVAEARALPIGIVPAGSGNDCARQFGLPSRPREGVQRILAAAAHPQHVDLGLVARDGAPDRWFAGGLSVGFDAAINRRANDLRLPLGPLRYVYGLAAEIFTLRRREFIVSVPGRDEHVFTGLLTTVMNIRTLGGGIPITPEAKVNDGRLDLIEVSSATKPRLLSVLGKLARGRHGTLPEVSITRVTQVRIDAGDEIAYADGEPVGTGPFTVTVQPGSLHLMV